MQVSKASARTRFKLGIIISTPQIETSIYTYSSYLRERARKRERELDSIEVLFQTRRENNSNYSLNIESLCIYYKKITKKHFEFEYIYSNY